MVFLLTSSSALTHHSPLGVPASSSLSCGGPVDHWGRCRDRGWGGGHSSIRAITNNGPCSRHAAQGGRSPGQRQGHPGTTSQRQEELAPLLYLGHDLNTSTAWGCKEQAEERRPQASSENTAPRKGGLAARPPEGAIPAAPKPTLLTPPPKSMPPAWPLGHSGIRVVRPQAWLPSPHPPPSPDSLAFCAHTQRAPLTACRCGLGSAPVLLWAPPGLLGWHDQPNVKWPCWPLGFCGAHPCWPGRECGDSPSRHCREKSSSVLSPPGPPPEGRAKPGLLPGHSGLPSPSPRCRARGLTAWVVQQLPLSLSQEKRGRGPAGESPEGQTGG